ncbi:SDR family oxidoreductase [Dietzia cinnamea]|uniref:SDR family oxidoreductase n=3 Tax=Dietzia TaxID=37914 RepID=UPI000D61B35E|nr:oxidoreductase [Dietzia maris]
MSDHPIVVTGAASGIGAALATLLRRRGVQVIGLDRTATDDTIPCDLSDPHSIQAAIDNLPAQLGGLANVAGLPGTASPEAVLRVNVLGPKLMAEGLLPRLTASSAVVNVASVAAHRNTQPPESVEQLISATTPEDIRAWLGDHPVDGPAAYDTSKRVLVDWTTRLAARLIGTDRRAISVSPGPVETPILGDFATSMGQESMERSVATVGRHGRPDEVAAVIGFALSPEASWLNGIDLLVEGGLMAARAAARATTLNPSTGPEPGPHEGIPS